MAVHAGSPQRQEPLRYLRSPRFPPLLFSTGRHNLTAKDNDVDFIAQACRFLLPSSVGFYCQLVMVLLSISTPLAMKRYPAPPWPLR